MAYTWDCPFCGTKTTIVDTNEDETMFRFAGSKHGIQGIVAKAIRCPNEACGEYQLELSLFDLSGWTARDSWKLKKSWRLIPQGSVKPFPKYISGAILADYEEACLIKDLSPKASATLSRRCLQGMIRDFWGVSKARLVDEIDGIKDKVDPATWAAIDSVRKIGNIGAHMEKDINTIIDVDSTEANLLITLIETLMRDWYITRHMRAEQMKAIIDAAAAKTKILSPPKAP